MAIYHCSAKTISRGKGQSAIAFAAYRGRAKLEDKANEEIKDFSARADQVEFSGIFVPKNAPDWMQKWREAPDINASREELWNTVEQGEVRKDAQLAREIVVSIPHELSKEQRRGLIVDFVREQFMLKGMIADVNIHSAHDEGDDRNVHAHIMLTMREVGPDGFGLKNRDWNKVEQLEKWRKSWAALGARHLKRAAIEKEKTNLRAAKKLYIESERFSYSHLTLAEQRKTALDEDHRDYVHAAELEREAQRYKGPTKTAMERKQKKKAEKVQTTLKMWHHHHKTVSRLSSEAKKKRRQDKIKAEFETSAKNSTKPVFTPYHLKSRKGVPQSTPLIPRTSRAGKGRTGKDPKL